MANEIFARKNEDGNYDIFDANSGEAITQIDDFPGTYPIGSQHSCAWEHPTGITLTPEQVAWLWIDIE